MGRIEFASVAKTKIAIKSVKSQLLTNVQEYISAEKTTHG